LHTSFRCGIRGSLSSYMTEKGRKMFHAFPKIYL